jgi:hypothetical protein
MANNSASGGYLLPSSEGGDLNDVGLITFLQQVVVGVTGLPGHLVRPRWQVEPPNIPDFGTNWAAIGPGSEDPDSFAFTQTTGLNTIVVSNRVIDILASFYGPKAQTNSVQMRMGLQVGQNREVMQLAGFNLVGGVGRGLPVPVLIKQRWQYRYDVSFRIRQQQIYTYSVLPLVAAQATLILQSGGSDFITDKVLSEATGGYNTDGFGEGGFGE